MISYKKKFSYKNHHVCDMENYLYGLYVKGQTWYQVKFDLT